ncbi:unnamed protein product [Plutella xylostella]|uniref:(diamondback moth) hypothetical protein n=1 Tax=Plutella xylostella TaxID=51655 RepID=A0A8S4EN14_PLUXY|nr:unnamed protein product [Plutella xylostella]
MSFPVKQAQVPVKVELTTVLLIVLVAVGVIASMTAVSATVFCCKYCSKKSNKNEKDKRQQDETSNIPLTGTKESESVDSLDKNPDIIPLDGKISDNSSNKSSTTDYSSIRPLISKTPSEKYDSIPPNCDRYTYDHNIDQCSQYIQLPAEQLMPPDMYSRDHSLYSQPSRTPLGVAQMPDIEPRYHLDPRSLQVLGAESRSCSSSPPVRFNQETSSVYFNKSMLDRPMNTLPHLSKHRVNGSSNQTQGNEAKTSVAGQSDGRWGSGQHMLTRVCNSGLTSEMQQPTLEPRGPAQSALYDDTACNTWRGI